MDKNRLIVEDHTAIIVQCGALWLAKMDQWLGWLSLRYRYIYICIKQRTGLYKSIGLVYKQLNTKIYYQIFLLGAMLIHSWEATEMGIERRFHASSGELF